MVSESPRMRERGRICRSAGERGRWMERGTKRSELGSRLQKDLQLAQRPRKEKERRMMFYRLLPPPLRDN